MYYVYILKSLTNIKSYVGITNNVKRRLSEHNNGNNYYTKRYKPWKIVHIERYNKQFDAHNREKYLKSCSGRKWMKENINFADVAELVYAQS